MPQLGPRVVVSGTHSGVGKTTVATGLMAALRRRGLVVGSAKVGPDYIDPGYHSVATGRPGRSLDAWLAGEELVAPLAADASAGADVLVVEGVMGLFDGSAQPGCDGSTAEIARLLQAPVVLVVDAGAMSGSVAAVVHGFATLDPRVQLAGVILNRVGGPGHTRLLEDALAPLRIPVVGAIEHDDALGWRERHLGLVPVAEHGSSVAESIDRLAAVIERAVDIEAVLELARSAPATSAASLPAARHVASARVALAAGAAFNFVYPENLALLAQAGAELVPFDPLTGSALPQGCDAVYAAGGFPEVFGEQLAANAPLLDDVRRAIDGGLVVWAECGGLMWLARSLDGHPLVGALAGDVRMTDSLTIGYRSAVTTVATPLGPVGTKLRGHEFHRSAIEPAGDALALSSPFGDSTAGFGSPTLFASYLHQHLAATPALAERFVHAAAAARRD